MFGGSCVPRKSALSPIPAPCHPCLFQNIRAWWSFPLPQGLPRGLCRASQALGTRQWDTALQHWCPHTPPHLLGHPPRQTMDNRAQVYPDNTLILSHTLLPQFALLLSIPLHQSSHPGHFNEPKAALSEQYEILPIPFHPYARTTSSSGDYAH